MMLVVAWTLMLRQDADPEVSPLGPVPLGCRCALRVSAAQRA